MKTFEPGQTIRLSIDYQENGEKVTGLTDLKVEGIDSEGNTVLSEQTLVETISDSSGRYEYDWNIQARG